MSGEIGQFGQNGGGLVQPVSKSFAQRPLRLIASDLFNALDRRRAAFVMGISVDQTYKIDSGERGIRLDGLEELYRHASTEPARAVAMEFLVRLGGFIGVRILHHEAIEEAFEILKTGNGHKGPRCPGCGTGLKESGILMGQTVYVCPGCKGAEVH